MQTTASNTKHCAICFSGQVRTAEREMIKENLEHNLYIPLRKYYDLKFFACTDKFYANYKWNAYMQIGDNNYWGGDVDLLNQRLMPGVQGGSISTMNQWLKCKGVSLLKQIYEMQNMMKFDMVIRIRPDSILNEPIKVETIDLCSYNIPNHDNWFGYNDQICIGNSENMDLYMSQFVDKIKKYVLEDGVIFHSETLLKHHIDLLNIQVNRLNVHTFIVRDGGPQYNITFN